jgi:hypothetical protein
MQPGVHAQSAEETAVARPHQVGDLLRSRMAAEVFFGADFVGGGGVMGVA